MAKNLNGAHYTRISLKWQIKRASRKLQEPFAWSQRLRPITNEGTENCWQTWNRIVCSRRASQSCGNAETADTCLKALKHQKNAQCATIPEASLKSGSKTTNLHLFL